MAPLKSHLLPEHWTISSRKQTHLLQAEHPNDARIRHAPGKIIILDSDDDDALVVRAKRKAHAESSSSCSDVEVVETEDPSSSSGKKLRAHGLSTVDVDESLHFAEFGRPKLLSIPTERSPGFPKDER